MNDVPSVKKNTLYNLIKTFSSIIFPLITFPYVSRMLGTESIGKINFGSSIVSYFSLIATLGVTTYAVRECSKIKDNREKLGRLASQIMSINVCTSLVAYMTLAICLFAAAYTVRKQAHMRNFWRGFTPMAAALGIVGMLLLLEPDLGAFIVIVAIAVGLLFLGGLDGRWFSALLGTLVSLFVSLIWFAPWRRERIFAYLDPWNPDNMYGSAYQLSHSLIALGRGEWFGVGLGSSVEKLHYLPEAHTDFIVAVIGEELGFIGVLGLIFAFAYLIWRAFDIGRQAIAMERVFNGLVSQGVGLWFGIQAFINMGVCLGLLPTKGLTLPLVSYGGSGIVMNMIAVALLLRVDYENRNLMRGKRT